MDHYTERAIGTSPPLAAAPALVAPPQSEVLYLLAVVTMGEGMVTTLSNKDTIHRIKKVLYEVWDEVWIRGWSISSSGGHEMMSPRLRALFTSVEYVKASNMLRAAVIRPLDGIRRSAQEVRPGLYISGKGPAMQPLLCRYLGITRILRCFAVQPRSEPPPPHPSASTQEGRSHKEYQRDIWAMAGVAGWDSVRHLRTHTTTPVTGGPSHIPVYHHEDELTYTPHGAGVEGVYTCRRLVLPAVDDDSYDVTAHLIPEVLQFAHSGGGGGLLVHCSAGMHRSATILAGILLSLPTNQTTTHLPCSIPTATSDVASLLEEIRAKRPLANPTPTQRIALNSWAPPPSSN